MNIAQLLLSFIGGTASMVAGKDGIYWPDAATPKRKHKRPLIGRGTYGYSLKAYFDLRNK